MTYRLCAVGWALGGCLQAYGQNPGIAAMYMVVAGIFGYIGWKQA
jgi:hypothetical protein